MTTMIVLIVAILVLAYLIVFKYRLYLKRKRFQGRKALTLESIHSLYYSELEFNEFRRAWKTAADILRLDYRVLRPSDSFIRELAPVWTWVEDESVDLMELDQIVDKETEVNTFDDVIQLIVGKT
jgi:hypothetical protein